MKTRQQGVTWIGLMIVAAIVGILLSIYIPSRSYYIPRSQASEAFTQTQAAKAMLAGYAKQHHGAFPSADALDALLPKIAADQLAAAAKNKLPRARVLGQYGRGDILAPPHVGIIYMFNSENVVDGLRDKTVIFIPLALPDSAAEFVWACKSGISQKFLPKSCQGA